MDRSAPSVTPEAPPRERWRVVVGGVVQGVGFRPFVLRCALAEGLTGWVRNDGAGVEIEAQGPVASLSAFVSTLVHRPPARARVDRQTTTRLAARADEHSFVVQESVAVGRVAPVLPADLATCAACLAELRAPTDRRFGYPFVNCTDCGPRYTIVEALPYDRPLTTMRRFALCAACRREYDDPLDRRYHAQPVACPRCGPTLRLVDAGGASLAVGDAALDEAVAVLRQGQILALKALGGYQLLVDGEHDAAVRELRARKQRPDKPFAVLVRDLAAARRQAVIDEAAASLLETPAAPIVLLPRVATATIAAAVAPGSSLVGVMLPSTPLHHLLAMAIERPLVCTSGNLAEEPLAFRDEEALARLAAIADRFLGHDRPIVRAVDDSVVRPTARAPIVVRRARGFAPEPIRVALADGCPPVLAVGAHQKSTITLLHDGQAIVSQHLGDLGTLEGNALHERTIADLLGFFDTRPAAIACDLHPDYASTRLAERLASSLAVPLYRVQHHHAHALALAAEQALASPFLALAWDGTGYGTDGTSWGGEALRVDGARFVRRGSLRPYALLGGDQAAREPRRSALGLWCSLTDGEQLPDETLWWSEQERRALRQLVGASPRTSSLGRLFDAVAALLGLRWQRGYEGQAALALELAAAPSSEVEPLPWRWEQHDALVLADAGPLVEAVVRRRSAGEPVGTLAYAFHAALAELAVAWASAAGESTVALTGGCFQNALLVELVAERLAAADLVCLTHHQVPPNDGGISLGQAVAAALSLRRDSD